MQALDQKARASQPPVSQPSASKRKAESAPQDEAEAKAPKTGMPYTDAAHRQLLKSLQALKICGYTH